MLTIKLIHPNKGIGTVYEKKISPCYKEGIIEMLQHKYGKKYYECDLVVTELKKPKIKYKATGEIFLSVKVAAKNTNYTETTIENHLNGNIPDNITKMFRYVGKCKA